MQTGDIEMKISLFFYIFLFVFKLSSGQTTIPGGDVSGVWAISHSPYHIEDNITIPKDSTLAIEPGVEVIFLGHYALNVQGQLLAVGSEMDSIQFTIIDTSGFHNPDTTLGGWNGIRFIETPTDNDSSLIIYCRLEYGKAVGNVWYINTGGAICVINFDKIRISNCLLSHNIAGGLMEAPSGGAIHLAWSDIKLTNNTFSYNFAKNGGGAIQFHESNPFFANNTFKNNSAFNGGAILIDAVSYPTFSNDHILNNTALSHGGGIFFGEPAVVVCEGITLEQNTAQWGGGIGSGGGELYATDCIITGNRAEVWGGGIAGDFTNLILNNCTFSNDTSDWGSGALHTDHTIAEINGCDFIGNTAVFGAGFHGVFSRLKFNQCLFTNNIADEAAGMHVENSNLNIDSCLFEGNVAQNLKAALEFRADSLIWENLYDLDILHTTFRENISPGIIAGVCIEQTDTVKSLIDVLVDHCEFINNNAYRVTALRMSGNIAEPLVSSCQFTGNTGSLQNAGVQFVSKCTGKLENCLFTFNEGGACVTINQEANLEIFNCTIANNKQSGAAGLSLRRGGKVLLTNSILWNNTPRQIALTTAADLGNEITVNYCNIQDGIDSVSISDSLCTVNWGVGNINSDPQFVDTEMGDFHLQDTSPCIGAGINCIKIEDVWHCAPSWDLEGLVRPSPNESNSDMGAYEHPHDIPTSMVNKDDQQPKRFHLYQNYPNPFNPRTTIKYDLPIMNFVEISIYNLLGQKISTLVSEEQLPGHYEVKFDGQNLSSGIYLCRIEVRDSTGRTLIWENVKKMILIR